MRRTVPVFLFAVLVAVFGFQVRSADAYPNVGTCANCHTFGNSGSTFHQGHLNLGLPNSCQTCHVQTGDTPLTPKCGVCHVAPGLPLHHDNAGVGASCVSCHPGTPAPENTAVPGYAGLTSATLDPCDGSEERFASNTISLDNDGDLAYDSADSDCAAAGTPDITVTDSVAPGDDLDVPFGSVTVGASSDQTVTVTNDGTADLVIGTVASPAAPFSILNDTCSGQTLAPVASCTLTARFSPTAPGAANDTFDIPSNDPDEDPVTVQVSGTGTSPTPVPDIVVTDSVAPPDDLQIPFGSITVGTSSDQTVTVSNAGNDNLVIGTIAQANPLAAPFSILNDTCSGQTVAPSNNCTFTVRFSPNSTAAVNDNFDIPSDDPDENPVTVSVSGTGTGAPVPDISVPASVDLGEVVENDTSAPSEVIISNTGNLELTVSSIAIDAGTDFTLNLGGGSNPCTTANPIIPAGDNCTVAVVFAPKSVGAISDNLAIASDDPDQPNKNVSLSGTGLDNVTPAVTAATGTGTITLDTSGNPGTTVSGIMALLDTDPSLDQTGKPTGVTFPHGLVSFTVNNVAAGGTITVDITFPAAIPAGSKYYKVNAGGFFEFAGAVISGNTVTLTLTDGGSGDLDAIPGTITDPGGLAVPVSQSSSSSSSGCSVIGSGGNGEGGAVLFLTLLAILVTLRRQRAKARR